MIQCPYCKKDFIQYKSIQGHVSHCKENTGEYFIDSIEGPIHYSNLTGMLQIRRDYPNLKATLGDIKKSFKRRNIDIIYKEFTWTPEDCIKAIKKFHAKFKRIPYRREFYSPDPGDPSERMMIKFFGSWNKAIEAAGFKANYDDGYGSRTTGKDGHLYRSNAEAYFADNYLFNKHIYVIEPKYPEEFNKWYDWYLPKLDLYIELDGRLRPEVIEEKKEINNKLGRNCLFISTDTIFNKNFEFYE